MNSIKCSILLFSFVLGTHAQTLTVTNDTVKVGEVATMTCIYTLPNGEVLDRLVWFRADADGTPVLGNPLVSTNTGETTNGRYSLSNDKDLMISAVEVNDAGNYLCRIVTQNTQIAEDYDKLIVQYLDTPVVTPPQLSVEIDDTAEFSTEPIGFPTPFTFTWIKDEVILDVSDTDKYPNSDATLTIKNVNETDEGVYKCRVENAAYMEEKGKLSNNVTLTIGSDDSNNDDNNKKEVNGAAIGGGVAGCVVVVGLCGGIGVYYKKKKKTPTGNVTKEGPSEVIGLTNDDDVTYAQVQKTAKSKEPKKTDNAPAKPKRAETNDTKKPDANAELTYVEVDHSHSGTGNKIIRTEPETEYSSVQPSSKR